jgi:hypothetical protein
MQSERFQLLARACEATEDKQNVVFYLQEALKADCQSVSAFEKLLDNFLVSLDDCKVLVLNLNYSKETVWLKDYYL